MKSLMQNFIYYYITWTNIIMYAWKGCYRSDGVFSFRRLKYLIIDFLEIPGLAFSSICIVCIAILAHLLLIDSIIPLNILITVYESFHINPVIWEWRLEHPIDLGAIYEATMAARMYSFETARLVQEVGWSLRYLTPILCFLYLCFFIFICYFLTSPYRGALHRYSCRVQKRVRSYSGV